MRPLEMWCLSRTTTRIGKVHVKISRNNAQRMRGARCMVFQTGAMRLSSIEIAEAYAVESRLSCVYARIIAHADYQSAYCMEPSSTTSTATSADPPASRKALSTKRPERLSPLLACSDTKVGYNYHAVIPRQGGAQSARSF
jgi:hypothetical protein